jgi:hypothetical protein
MNQNLSGTTKKVVPFPIPIQRSNATSDTSDNNDYCAPQ